MNNKILTQLPVIAFALVMTVIVFLCVTVQGNYAVNGNISWLLIGAERLLQGQTMAEHIYEPNPPLSLIIYIPHVLFSWLSGLSLPIASYYVTGALAILSTLASYLIINRYPFLKEPEKLAFTACYAVAITLTTVIFYSEREHFMILGMGPFMLAQFALMEKIKLPKRLYIPVFVLGAIGFLIKPNYGLMPTIFLVTRVIKHRNINPLKHPDFIALAAMTLLYLGIVFTLFNDYVQIILPDLVFLYVGSGQDYSVILQASALQALLYITVFLLELFHDDQKEGRGRFIRYMHLCAILNLIPYYMQMKGYFNHLIPANSFFMMAVCCSITLRLTPFMTQKFKWKEAYKSSLSIVLPFICVLGISTALIPFNNDFPTHKDLRNLPVAKYLEENCKQPCSFLSFHPDMEIMPPTAAIMEYEHASRFGSLWPLIGMLSSLESDDPDIRADAQKTKERYSRYMLEDMRYYEPSLLVLAKDVLTSVDDISINFMEFFGAYEPLKIYVDEHYIKVDEFEYDRSPYFKGTTMDYEYTLFYDIYERRDPQ